MGLLVKALIGIVFVALLYQFATTAGSHAILSEASMALVKPVAGFVLGLLNEPAFVFLASLVIVFAGLVACGWYWVGAVQPRRREVRATAAELADLLALTREGVSKPEDMWPALQRIVPHNGFFAASWGLFAASRQQGTGGDRPLPFSWYVAQDPAIDGRGRSNLMASLPGYFTTVGLILTFVGLVAALYFASRGFRSGDMAEARAAIVQLLAASSFKFLTSVAALSSAFIVSLFIRFADARLRDDIAAVALLVDEASAHSPLPPSAIERLTGAVEALAWRLDQLAASSTASAADALQMQTQAH